MYKPQKKKNGKRLYQVIGMALLCVLVVYMSYTATTAWFLDESITSNGKPNIMIIGTVDLDVKSNFNFYNLVLAPDTYYTTYTENGVPRSYGTYLTTSEDNDVKTIARHEVKLNLENVIKASRYVLKNGGTFAMVHRPERMIEIINLMQKYGIEPKKMRLVYPKVGKEANILLIEGIKNGKTGLKVLSPLFTHNEDGSYVLEIKEMFGGN